MSSNFNENGVMEVSLPTPEYILGQVLAEENWGSCECKLLVALLLFSGVVPEFPPNVIGVPPE